MNALALLPFALCMLTPSQEADLAPGRVGGPGVAVDRVEAHATDSFEVLFRGGEVAAVVVQGDGDTDLDLFVYDENGNLIASDVGATDVCVATWTPRWTGRFRVEVRNLGDVYNRYRLETN